jgi:ribonuclease-3
VPPVPEPTAPPLTPPADCELRRHIGAYLHDEALFALALSHRSFCAETPGTESNERLEFLGDAVLGIVVTDHLYRSSPDLAEGSLAKARAAVVSTEALAAMAEPLGVGPALRLGRGEEASRGREKASILADALEALIGAVYLDNGLEAVRAFVMEVAGERIAASVAEPGFDDHKTRLQELAAALSSELPRYHVADTGPDHAKHFVAEVFVGPERLGAGEGRSKKQAEQRAARSAAAVLRERLAARDA